MTPQTHIAPPAHLTSAQMESLFASSSALPAAEAHLLRCEACAAELANLRDSLALFRSASNVHANRELQSLPPISVPNRGLLLPALQPAHWVAVAATLLIAILPIQSLRQRSAHSVAVSASASESTQLQSDAALLDDVDREASASVPTSMQALADPTATGDTDADTASIQAPDQSPDLTPPAQRKD
jgi:anti-sigma factor RsiW